MTSHESIYEALAEVDRMTKLNSGHGRVIKRPDGYVEVCGGPGYCDVCNDEHMRKEHAHDAYVANLLEWDEYLPDGQGYDVFTPIGNMRVEMVPVAEHWTVTFIDGQTQRCNSLEQAKMVATRDLLGRWQKLTRYIDDKVANRRSN